MNTPPPAAPCPRMLVLTVAVGSAIAVAACTPAGFQMAESRRLQAVNGGGAHPAWDTQAAAADTVRYTLLPLGVQGGTRSVWWETPQLRLHRLDFRGSVLESRTELDAAGAPLLVETYGIHPRTGVHWEDEDDRLFADRSTVPDGWESVHPEPMAASAEAVAGHAAALLGGLIPAPRERPLVIRRARLFDPARRTTTPATSIVIRGNRVAAVGPDDSIDVAIDAEVMDAAGRTVLPGLWDLHVHTHEGFIEELDAPLFVAAGVTTVRDLGGDTVARALANDHTERAGRMVGGELHIELEVVEAEWFPRGPHGPRIVTPAFAEVGRAPSVPGPLIRAAAGTPVVVTVTNHLERAIQVRGLDGRKSAVARPPGTPPTFPDFFFADSLVIPAGESRTARFRQGQELTSFYYARTIPPAGVLAPPSAVPGGIADEGALMGALVMDPPGGSAHEDERVFMITRWGSPAEPGSLDPSWKMMINGLAWPATERIELTIGDTARWRIINASAVDHPMHLHGFYFFVDGTGDTQADTVFAAQDRREVVTEVMKEYSSLRLRWTPDRPGNWLFHCHLIRHMGELQRFQIDREAGEGGDHDMPDMDGMAGLITGITVHPAPGVALEDPVPVRRIDLWTGRRDGVFADRPELGFVVQDGARPPSPDSTRVPGSPLILTRGQPTEIVIHNRLDFPLSVHWHGLELRSLYDGVGHWSGEPGMTRPPIPPADSQRVIIDPPRAGTFFYHTHGEPGHELQQGLYGAFLVLDEGESRDRDADRFYVLASRGAQIDAPPSINGQVRPEPEQFQPGRTYRLRFIHISPDEFKRVRLIRDGDAVEWLPLAKDGADLPEHRRAAVPAELGIGVGEAYDFLWTPDRAGIHVLEVRTNFYPNRGGSVTQRQAFAVGEASESAIRMATTGTDLSMVDLTAEERARYVGTYIGRLEANDDQRDWVFTVWENDNEGLYSSAAPREDWDGAASYLIPLGDHAFVPGRYEDGLVAVTEPDVSIRFGAVGERAGRAEIAGAGGPLLPLQRVGVLTLTEDELLPLVGSYTAPGLPVEVLVQVSDGALSLAFGPGPPARLVPMSRSRFRIEGPGVPPGTRIRFDLREGRVTGALVTSPGGQLSMPLVRKD